MRRGKVIRIGIVLVGLCVSAYNLPAIMEKFTDAMDARRGADVGALQGLLAGPAPANAAQPGEIVIVGAEHLSPEERARLLEEARRTMPAQPASGATSPGAANPNGAPGTKPPTQESDEEAIRRIEEQVRRLLEEQREPK